MHVVGIRRELAERHPWLPGAVLKAFEQSKEIGMAKLSDTSATKVTLPFVEEALRDARALMGEDFWSYGVDKNRKTLDYFLGHHHAQGLSPRRVSVDELFHPATYESVQAVRIGGELHLSGKALEQLGFRPGLLVKLPDFDAIGDQVPVGANVIGR